jgi:hypothetical protein
MYPICIVPACLITRLCRSLIVISDRGLRLWRTNIRGRVLIIGDLELPDTALQRCHRVKILWKLPGSHDDDVCMIWSNWEQSVVPTSSAYTNFGILLYILITPPRRKPATTGTSCSSSSTLIGVRFHTIVFIHTSWRQQRGRRRAVFWKFCFIFPRFAVFHTNSGSRTWSGRWLSQQRQGGENS